MSIFVACALVLAVGFALAVLLKREGERSWQRHQAMVAAARRREAFASFNKALVRVHIELVDNLTPALRKVNAEIQQLARAIEEAS